MITSIVRVETNMERWVGVKHYLTSPEYPLTVGLASSLSLLRECEPELALHRIHICMYA